MKSVSSFNSIDLNPFTQKPKTLEGLEGKHHPLYEQSYFTLTGVVFAKSG